MTDPIEHLSTKTFKRDSRYACDTIPLRPRHPIAIAGDLLRRGEAEAARCIRDLFELATLQDTIFEPLATESEKRRIAELCARTLDVGI
jgi:hypothetical protein